MGDPVTIAGAGFTPGSQVLFEICAALTADPEVIVVCAPMTEQAMVADDDGELSLDAVIPDWGRTVPVATTTCGQEPGQCQPGVPTDLEVRCDGVETSCALRASASGVDTGRPFFGPAPVPITFRPPA